MCLTGTDYFRTTITSAGRPLWIWDPRDWKCFASPGSARCRRGLHNCLTCCHRSKWGPSLPVADSKPEISERLAGHSSCSSGFRATDEFVHSPHCSKRQRANVSRIKLIIWFVNALFGNIMLCWPSLPKEYHLYNTLICQSINKIMLTLSIVVWETNPQTIATYRAGKQTPNTNVKISPSWGKWNHSWTDRFTQ